MITSDRTKIQVYSLPNFIVFAIAYIKNCVGMRRILKRTKTYLFSRIQSANLKVETHTAGRKALPPRQTRCGSRDYTRKHPRSPSNWEIPVVYQQEPTLFGRKCDW